MQWRKVKRNELDEQKWSDFVAHYAGAYYHSLAFLDGLGVPFQALIGNDYEVCFPLFENKKWGVISYVFQPILVQRFFVPFVYRDKLMQYLRANYFHYDLSLATEHMGDGEQVNMLLPPGNHGNLKSKVQAACRKIEEGGVEVVAVTNAVAFQFMESHLFDAHLFDKKEIAIVSHALLQSKTNIESYALRHEGKILGVASILKLEKRWIYLKGTIQRHGTFSELGVFLLKHIIAQRPDNTTFDFSGSMIPGVAAFFRKFKPQVEYYQKYTYFKCSILQQLR